MNEKENENEDIFRTFNHITNGKNGYDGLNKLTHDELLLELDRGMYEQRKKDGTKKTKIYYKINNDIK